MRVKHGMNRDGSPTRRTDLNGGRLSVPMLHGVLRPKGDACDVG